MKICGVVVFYNPSFDVSNKIKSYLNFIEKLYVVDNSNNQDNRDKLPKSKKIEYVNNHENLGIAKALNIACEKALLEGFDYILTMDQDSEFEESSLTKLIQFVNDNHHPLLGIVTPYHLIETNVPRCKLSIEHPVEVMTSGNLVNLSAYKDVGGFKDWLFIDCVDIEFCMNLRVHGYDIIRLNDVEMNHCLGDSKTIHFLWKTCVTTNHNALRRYYIARNCYYIYDMYHEYFPLYCDYVRGGIKYQIRNIFLFEKNKFKKIRNSYRGIRDYKKGIKGKYPYSN